MIGRTQAEAIEPIQRVGPAKLKLGLAAYSYHDLLSGDPPKLTLDDFVFDCAKMQVDAAELTSYYFPKEFDREYLLGLKQLCFREGLDISGTAVGNDFCHVEPEKHRQQVADVKRWVDHAAVLGAPVIRIFAGYPKDRDVKKARKQTLAAIEECCDYAGKQGIYLALENHGGLTDGASDMLALVSDVRSRWFGVNLDTGNFHSADVYADLARLAPYAVTVQVKVAWSGHDHQMWPTDFRRVAKLLADAGYRGYVVLEFEKSAPELHNADPREACRRYTRELRAALQSAMG